MRIDYTLYTEKMIKKYLTADFNVTGVMMFKMHTAKEIADAMVKKIIVNGPATIVFWKTGEKTVVKCDENDAYDLEKAFAMAFLKYSLGNMGKYYSVATKILDKVEVM